MTLLEKEDSFFGEKEQQQAFDEIKHRLPDPQSYIYLTDMDDFNCIPTPADLPLLVLYTKFKMDNQSS